MARPSNTYRKTLRAANTADYKLLLRICIEAVLNRQPEVILATSHLFKFPKDFPKGITTKKEHPVVYRRIKTNRLLHWLNKHGHSEVTMEDLRVEQRKITLLEKEIVDMEFDF